MRLNLFHKYCGMRRSASNILPLLVATFFSTFYFDYFVNCTLINFQPKPNSQRRFMWRQMTHTMDDFVDDMMSGARSVFGGMLQPATQQSTQLLPNEYLSSETTRVKYIIRDPHTNKPMKIIKMGPQKKVIRVLGINRPSINNNQSHNNKSHKNQNSNKDIYQNTAVKYLGKYEQKKPVTEEHEEEKDKGEEEHQENIVGGKIYDLDETWKPVEAAAFRKPYATIKSYPMSQLHTNIMGETSSLTISSPSQDYATDKSHRNKGKLNTPIKDAAQESNIIRPHMYEVTEYVAEESVALEQTKNFSSRNSNSNYEQLPISFKQSYKPPMVTVPHPITTTSTTTTTTSASTTTSEPPNYPAGFLKSFYDVSARKSFPQFTANNYKRIAPIEENIWLPLNHTLPPLTYRKPNTKSLASITESAPTLATIDRTPILRTPHTRLGKEPQTTTVRPITSRPKHLIKYNDKLMAISTSVTVTTPKSMRHRGTVKFGDKLNWE